MLQRYENFTKIRKLILKTGQSLKNNSYFCSDFHHNNIKTGYKTCTKENEQDYGLYQILKIKFCIDEKNITPAAYYFSQ
ncbi:MAG: hypothetical protein LBU57_07820 [Dysgonamonadaceae bacterium]|jgi:hypothetical protein|nr:hypothetical protein [Dysgonamonadaceae bacterium]